VKRGRARELPAALSQLGRAQAAPEPAAWLRSPGLDGSDRPVGRMLRRAAVICPASTPVREAAERMVAAGASAVLVHLGDGLGIVTDQDLRTRVLAAGAGLDTPRQSVMTTPTIVVAEDRTAADVLLEMLELGIRHFPVVDAGGRVVGMVDDVDLMVAERGLPFHLQRSIAHAENVKSVVALARQLPQTLIALQDGLVASSLISRVISSIEDALTRRLIELAMREFGDQPPAEFTWLALGSSGRRESFPGSDQDNALAWVGGGEDPMVRRWMRTLARRVIEGLEQCGIAGDPNGTLASSRRFSRALVEWERAAAAWAAKLDYEAVIIMSAIADGRSVSPNDVVGSRLVEAFSSGPDQEQLRRRLAILALAHRPPAGFVRDFVVEHSGAHKGLLDIKHGGLRPIVDLARWAMIAARLPVATSTVARLDTAEAAGTLEADEAAVLRDAFELITAVRMRHQVEQLRAGQPPTDHIDPNDLTGLTRRYLKEAFQEVGQVQRGLEARMGLRLV
jgi:CBS domain-containing protein